ncbi:MAG: hypothetical protein ACJAS1_000903, partial [Oleiphilaceae bacterium]
MLKNEIRIINTTKHLLLLMLLIYSAYLLAKLFWFVLMPVNIS